MTRRTLENRKTRADFPVLGIDAAVFASDFDWHSRCSARLKILAPYHSLKEVEMDQQVHISYLGLVRNVIGCREEEFGVERGTTVGQLLRLLADKHGLPFQQSVLKQSGELRATAQVCVDDRDISELAGFDTPLGKDEQITILVGVYPPEGG